MSVDILRRREGELEDRRKRVRGRKQRGRERSKHGSGSFGTACGAYAVEYLRDFAIADLKRKARASQCNEIVKNPTRTIDVWGTQSKPFEIIWRA
jgi:hypothetical protein